MNNDSKTENHDDDKLAHPPAAEDGDSAASDGNGGETSDAPAANEKPAGGTGQALWRLFVLLLLIALLAALAGGAWYGWQWLQKEKTNYDARAQAQIETVSRLQARLDRVTETLVEQQEFTALQNDLQTTSEQLRDRMASISDEMETLREAAKGGQRDLVKSEIEYLLRIAADELYLTQDVDTAMHALQAADDRLQQLADPRLTPVRQLVADHLRALGNVNMQDTSGVALKLGSLMRQVSELPLRQAQHSRAVDEDAATTPEDASWWKRLKNGVNRVFDKLVVVQRAEPPAPLLRPEEHFFLYRNVELQLATARAALLMRDATTYRQSLEVAREWLLRFFDRNDPAVANAIADISGLLEVPLQPELPDITPALERFRALAGNALRSMGRGE